MDSIGITSQQPLHDITVRWNPLGPTTQRDLSIRFADPDENGFQRVTQALAGVHVRPNIDNVPLDLDNPDIARGVQALVTQVAGVDEPLDSYWGRWMSGRLGADSAEDIKDFAWKIERNYESGADFVVPDWWAGYTLGRPDAASAVVDAAKGLHAVTQP